MNMQKFKTILNNKIITSTLFVLVTFVLNFLRGKRFFFVVDDAIMNNIARGGNSVAADDHLIFMNVIFGKVCKWLNSVYDGINWFELSYIVLIIVSATVLFIVLNRNVNNWLSLLICVVVEIFAIRFYTFTTISFVCTTISIICITEAIPRLTKKSAANIALLVVSLLLFFAGQMFREESWIISMCLSFPFVIAFLIRHFKDCKKTIIILAVGVIIISSLIKFADYRAYSSDKYKEFQEYNVARSKVIDYPIANYDDKESEYKKLGISRNDYSCLRNKFGTVKFVIGDRNVFSKDVLEKMTKMSDKKTYNNSAWVDELLEFGQIFICLVLGIILLVCDKGKRKFYYLAQIVVSYAIVLSLIFVVHRAKPIVVLTVLFVSMLNLIFFYAKGDREQKKYKVGSILIAVVFLFNAVALIVGNQNAYNERYQLYKDSRPVRKYVANNEDKLFIMPTTDYNNCYHRINDRLLSKADRNVNSLPTFDWYTYLDDYNNKLEKYGIKDKDSLLLSMTDKNVYYISDGSIKDREERENIRVFIEEHGHNKNVYVEPFEKIKGTDFTVYKYYIKK